MSVFAYFKQLLYAIVGKDMATLHPELTHDREFIGSMRSDAVNVLGAYNYLSALGDYENHVWVRKAINVIANNFSPLPLLVRRNGEVVESHPLAIAYASVNPQMSAPQLWEQWVIDMLMGGEEGHELVFSKGGAISEIYPRQPHTIGVVPDRALMRYFEVRKYVIDDNLSEPYDLKPEEFVHFKFFNPRNVWRGLSFLSAIKKSVRLDSWIQDQMLSFYRSGARPDYAIVAPQGLTKDERDAILKRVSAAHGGILSESQPIVLEEGITDIKPFSFRPRDLGVDRLREFSRDEIAGIFGVPDILMGFGADTYDTEQKRNAALGVLFSLTIIPLAQYRDLHITKFWRKRGLLKANEELVTDYANVSALKADLQGKLTMWAMLVDKGVPPYLAAQFLELPMPRYQGDDYSFLSSALIAVPPNSVPPVAAIVAEAEKSYPPRSIAYGSAEHKGAMERFGRRIQPYVERFADVVTQLFFKQQEDVLRRLRNTKAKSPIDVAADPFDIAEWERLFRETVQPELAQLVADMGAYALSDVGAGIAFDVFEPMVEHFLKDRAQRFAEHVSETTWNALQDSLSAGLRDGESIAELSERVLSVMADRIRSTPETIARTEIVGAANGGTLLAWEQSGVVEQKQWLAALDDRTRESHIDAHGQTVGLLEEFVVGGCSGQAPGQTGCPEEDINCRCTMTAIVAKTFLPTKVGYGKNLQVPYIGTHAMRGGNGHTIKA